MEPLITVIVPVYNGEAYIEKCFDSILNQTYKNLEIIIINDGSTDRSATICDAYAERDERVIVVHQENVGLPSVRNRGLAMASGELIGFVDCDDSIHPRMYEILAKQLHDTNADVAMCEVTRVQDSNIEEHIKKSERSIVTQQVQILNQAEAFRNLYNEKNLITVVPWNKLYRKEVFHHIQYPDGKRADDEFVIHHIIQAIQKIVFTNAILYYYYDNVESITNEKYNLNRLDGIEAMKDRLLLFEYQQYKKLLQITANMYLHFIIIHYFKVKEILPNETRVIEDLNKRFKRDFQYYKRFMTFKQKMELRFFFIHPIFYSKFIKLRERLSHFLFFRRTLIKS